MGSRKYISSMPELQFLLNHKRVAYGTRNSSHAGGSSGAGEFWIGGLIRCLKSLEALAGDGLGCYVCHLISVAVDATVVG